MFVRHVRGIADDTCEDIAGDSKLGFNGSDFNRFADLPRCDWDLQVEIDRVSIGGLDRSPVTSIDPVFDASNFVERDIVLGAR